MRIFERYYSCSVILLLVLFLGQNIALGSEAGIEYSFENRELNRKLIDLYEASPLLWEDNNLHIIALCYVLEKDYANAEKVFKKYLLKHPNNARAIRGLANVYLTIKDYTKAKVYYEKGWKLKDVDSLSKLIVVNVVLKEFEDIKKLLPDIMANRDKSIRTRMDMAEGLIIYSLFSKPPNKEIFLKAIEGLEVERLIKYSELNMKEMILKGIEIFELENMKTEISL